MEKLSPRELDSIYRATVATTLEHWPSVYDERSGASGSRSLLVLSALVMVAVAALCLISPDILGVKF